MILAKKSIPVCLKVVEELVCLFCSVAEGNHLVSLFLIDDILLGVCSSNNLIVVGKVGSELFINGVFNITENEY